LRERLEHDYAVELTDYQVRDIVDYSVCEAMKDKGKIYSILDRGDPAIIVDLRPKRDLLAVIKKNLFKTEDDPQEMAVITMLPWSMAKGSFLSSAWELRESNREIDELMVKKRKRDEDRRLKSSVATIGDLIRMKER
jgi:hypothetical protein